MPIDTPSVTMWCMSKNRYAPRSVVTQRARASGAADEIERHDELFDRGVALGLGRGELGNRQHRGRGDVEARGGAIERERAAERVEARDQRRERGSDRVARDPRADREHARDVVGRARRLHLLEQEHPRLDRRRRHRLGDRDWLDRAERALAYVAQLADPPRERAHGRMAEHVRHLAARRRARDRRR